MARITPGIVVGATLATLAAGGLGYAVYFDYKRRNDPVFRRALAKEQRKLAKASEAQASRERASQADSLKSAVRQLKNERPPTNLEEREAYFLEQVAIGEALAAKGPAFYVPAAISFFKGLQVYPQPQELLMIYSKTQPAEVVQLLMEALKLSLSEGEGSSPSGSSPTRDSGAERSRKNGGAVLEEIETDSQDGESASQRGGAAKSRAGASGSQSGSQNGEGNSATSSPGARSYVDVQFPAVSSS